jgi:hypothetical protein
MKYYWRVRAFNTAGEFSAWSLVRYFRIAYAAPINLSPADLAINVPLKPTFTWDAITGATSYTIQVSRNITFTLLVVNKIVTTNSYAHTLNLLKNYTYYWRVRANGLYGPGAWSTPILQFLTIP